MRVFASTRLDVVRDGRHRAVDERDEAGRAHADLAAGGRAPVAPRGAARRRAGRARARGAAGRHSECRTARRPRAGGSPCRWSRSLRSGPRRAARMRSPRAAAGAPRRRRSGRCPGCRRARPRRGCRAGRCGRSTGRRPIRSGRACRARAPARERTTARRRTGRRPPLDQLAQVVHHHVRPVLRQGVPLPGPVHPHHPAESAGTAGLDAGQGVLEHHRLLRLGAERARRRL